MQQRGFIYGYSYRLHNADQIPKRLHLDFYLPKATLGTKQSIGIEFDGNQHDTPIIRNHSTESQAQETFRKQLNYDDEKNKYCKKHNIKLIRIKTVGLKIQGLSGTFRQQKALIDHILDKQLLPLVSLQQRQNRSRSHKYQALANQQMGYGYAKINHNSISITPQEQKGITEQDNNLWNQVMAERKVPQSQRNTRRINKKNRAALKNHPKAKQHFVNNEVFYFNQDHSKVALSIRGAFKPHHHKFSHHHYSAQLQPIYIKPYHKNQNQRQKANHSELQI